MNDAMQLINEAFPTQRGLHAAISRFTDYLDMAEQFIKIQPVYYDKGHNWWLWNHEQKSWERTDETDLLIDIDEAIRQARTINNSDKSKIIEALKRTGRKNKPKDVPKTWVQFRNCIVDITSGERHDATPEWFTTNPIPWTLENNESTPIIDKTFKEWVGTDNTPILYEIIAYCMLPDYPIHRIFCLVGCGCNGKGRFLELLSRTIGHNNITSTELETLMNSRFEKTRLFKKLACTMGETNFATLSKTSILKQLTGQDLIGFEFKHKTPFDDYNYAKILVATNSLPITTDKTDGFYRRWQIIDFPNQFSEEQDVLASIPEEEYPALCLKCVRILQGLVLRRTFMNEGNIAIRRERYEEKSNPLSKFVITECTKKIQLSTLLSKFTSSANEYLKSEGHRTMTAKQISRWLRDTGYAVKGGKGNQTTIFGIKINEINEINVLPTNSHL